MAALGAVTPRTLPIPRTTLLPISAYTIRRGNYLGTVATRNAQLPQATLNPAVANYIVRQLSILYRQLWPPYGQRFPQ